MTVASASVVIPAHNEEASLPPSLRVLLATAEAGEFEIVVVANGCRDATAQAARRVGAELGLRIDVVEIPQASKTTALNVGDWVATAFPRIYLDADVACSTSTARIMVETLREGSVELAVATRRLDLVNASWWVRQYYRAWQLLPRVEAELSGRGAYAFSRAGRQRFERFPSLTADDYWAVRQVPRDRAVAVPSDIVIRPPMDTASLIRVRSRIYAANRAAGNAGGKGVSGRSDIGFLVRRPRSWLSAGVFFATNAYIKTVGVRRRGTGRDSVRGSPDPPLGGDNAYFPRPDP